LFSSSSDISKPFRIFGPNFMTVDYLPEEVRNAVELNPLKFGKCSAYYLGVVPCTVLISSPRQIIYNQKKVSSYSKYVLIKALEGFNI
jgi:hypothetical protein